MRTQTYGPGDLTTTERSIPSEIKSLPQFVVWKLETRASGDKPTKVPYDAKTGRRASSINPKTWAKFDIALRAIQSGSYNGIGFVFANGYCGVDFDKCRDPETGEIESWALEMIEKLDSYTEVSPSGTGLHVIARAKLDGEGKRKGPIELYDNGRYFTLTGQHLEGTPTEINDRQEIISRLYEAIREIQTGKKGDKKARQKPPAVVLTLDDERILELTRKAGNSAKFERLWGGGTADYDDDRSRADLALVSILCFYTQDDFQVERLWKQSGLYRTKLERADYVQRTIRTARAQQTETYGAKPAPARQFEDAQDISELEEIADDDPSISDDPKRERYLRQCARNAAKVLDAIRLIFLYLGFKKNHNRILTALIRKGKDRLKPFPAKHEWLLQQYVKNGEKVSSEKTVQRDIQELRKEEDKLGVKVFIYISGNESRASIFQNLFMRYALEAIDEAMNRSGEFDYSWQALEAVCKEVAGRIPRNPLLTSEEVKKRDREDGLKRAKRKAMAEYTNYLRLLLEEGQEIEAITREAGEISSHALRRIRRESERLLSGQSCPPPHPESEEVLIIQ